ncbi:hypothetical protein O0L34_g16828 [Tuta absoluta]|nr:hypothetical protein O0L34_g16828 [Tuta absoluta]
MGEAYFNLKLKLEELGYNNALPQDAVPLVECILADLLQTTRSLQHYMDLSKETLKQRDSMLLEAEPYRCENAKLIQENCKLHKDIMLLKEEYERLSKETKRKIRTLCEELMKKDSTITKLQLELRDMSLRGLCADTLSSRNKSRKKDSSDSKTCTHAYGDFKTNIDRNTLELEKKMNALEQQNEIYKDEVILLKNQIEHRDSEIVRLNMMLEGGRPFAAPNRENKVGSTDTRTQELLRQLAELENANEAMKKEIDSGLEKQHEAMLRALALADKNKKLHEELKKVDALALKVEEDCNKRLATMVSDIDAMQEKIKILTLRNSELEKQIETTQNNSKHQEALHVVVKEKETLQSEIKNLMETNKSLNEKIQTLVQETLTSEKESRKCPTKTDLQRLLEEERKKYENHIFDMQTKLEDTMQNFSKLLRTCKDTKSTKIHGGKSTNESNSFIKHLHNKLCESEQKVLMLKKEIDEYKKKVDCETEGSKQNYKDIISQLNTENSELSKENISLSQQLSQYKNSMKSPEQVEIFKKEIQRLKDEISCLSREMHILQKDKQEYNSRCKDALDMIDKLKRDLAFKQREIEKLEEENCSYKMTHRTGKASADHLKEECNFLRDQIKRIQSDVIKEKTLANQIKNIQLETERSSCEMQNELLSVQKQLHLKHDTIDALERKCKDLQSEIISLQNDKSNMIDNFKKVDQERDKLVIELDHKAETISALEQKLKSQSNEIRRSESEIMDMKQRLNMHKVAEHQLSDSESQIKFLNGEILRLQQKLDSAIIENKHLQNSLGDANGALKLNKIEYDKSRREVEGLKQQLQHYVAEIRRIEELLSHKEAERFDMLEQFASLSVEANILENNNHSLESESASKSQQLQSYISKIQDLESKLQDRESIIESQSTRIATLTCKVTSLENEIKLITEEKTILEQNVAYLKKMCGNLQNENANVNAGIGETDSELRLYESKLRNLTSAKVKLQAEKDGLQESLMTTEKLLSNARREIVDLKLALQDATSETKTLHERVNELSRREEHEIHETIFSQEELQLPLMLDDTLHEVSQEEDEISMRYREVHKRYSKFTHGSTL